jgi:hypothetical protein
MAKNEPDRLLYLLVGCAGLGFLGLCAATGVGVYLFAREGGAAQENVSPVTAPAYDPGAKPPFGAPSDPAPAAPSAPRLRVAATVTSVSVGEGGAAAGGFGLAPGASCLFDVQAPGADSPMCRAQIVCGGRLLYGGESAGYFPCTVAPDAPPSVAGEDAATTGEDGDAAMRLDTRAGRLSVEDDARGPLGAFAIEAHIDSVE